MTLQEKTATGNVMTRDAHIACDFSRGVLDGTERGDLFIEEAYLLQNMRRDNKLFVTQLYNLEEKEREMLVCFMRIICQKETWQVQK